MAAEPEARLLSHCFPTVAKPGGKLGSQGGARQGRLRGAETSVLARVVQDRYKTTSQIKKGPCSTRVGCWHPQVTGSSLKPPHLPAPPSSSATQTIMLHSFCFWSLLSSSIPFTSMVSGPSQRAGLWLPQSCVLVTWLLKCNLPSLFPHFQLV